MNHVMRTAMGHHSAADATQLPPLLSCKRDSDEKTPEEQMWSALAALEGSGGTGQSSHAPAACGSAASATPHLYELVSVIYHKGGSARAGHYVSDVWDGERATWWRIDDEVVEPVAEAKDVDSGVAAATRKQRAAAAKRTNQYRSPTRKPKRNGAASAISIKGGWEEEVEEVEKGEGEGQGGQHVAEEAVSEKGGIETSRACTSSRVGQSMLVDDSNDIGTCSGARSDSEADGDGDSGSDFEEWSSTVARKTVCQERKGASRGQQAMAPRGYALPAAGTRRASSSSSSAQSPREAHSLDARRFGVEPGSLSALQWEHRRSHPTLRTAASRNAYVVVYRRVETERAIAWQQAMVTASSGEGTGRAGHAASIKGPEYSSSRSGAAVASSAAADSSLVDLTADPNEKGAVCRRSPARKRSRRATPDLTLPPAPASALLSSLSGAPISADRLEPPPSVLADVRASNEAHARAQFAFVAEASRRWKAINARRALFQALWRRPSLYTPAPGVPQPIPLAAAPDRDLSPWTGSSVPNSRIGCNSAPSGREADRNEDGTASSFGWVPTEVLQAWVSGDPLTTRRQRASPARCQATPPKPAGVVTLEDDAEPQTAPRLSVSALSSSSRADGAGAADPSGMTQLLATAFMPADPWSADYRVPVEQPFEPLDMDLTPFLVSSCGENVTGRGSKGGGNALRPQAASKFKILSETAVAALHDPDAAMAAILDAGNDALIDCHVLPTVAKAMSVATDAFNVSKRARPAAKACLPTAGALESASTAANDPETSLPESSVMSFFATEDLRHSMLPLSPSGSRPALIVPSRCFWADTAVEEYRTALRSRLQAVEEERALVAQLQLNLTTPKSTDAEAKQWAWVSRKWFSDARAFLSYRNAAKRHIRKAQSGASHNRAGVSAQQTAGDSDIDAAIAASLADAQAHVQSGIQGAGAMMGAQQVVNTAQQEGDEDDEEALEVGERHDDATGSRAALYAQVSLKTRLPPADLGPTDAIVSAYGRMAPDLFCRRLVPSETLVLMQKQAWRLAAARTHAASIHAAVQAGVGPKQALADADGDSVVEVAVPGGSSGEQDEEVVEVGGDAAGGAAGLAPTARVAEAPELVPFVLEALDAMDAGDLQWPGGCSAEQVEAWVQAQATTIREACSSGAEGVQASPHSSGLLASPLAAVPAAVGAALQPQAPAYRDDELSHNPLPPWAPQLVVLTGKARPCSRTLAAQKQQLEATESAKAARKLEATEATLKHLVSRKSGLPRVSTAFASRDVGPLPAGVYRLVPGSWLTRWRAFLGSTDLKQPRKGHSLFADLVCSARGSTIETGPATTSADSALSSSSSSASAAAQATAPPFLPPTHFLVFLEQVAPLSAAPSSSESLRLPLPTADTAGLPKRSSGTAGIMAAPSQALSACLSYVEVELLTEEEWREMCGRYSFAAACASASSVAGQDVVTEMEEIWALIDTAVNNGEAPSSAIAPMLAAPILLVAEKPAGKETQWHSRAAGKGLSWTMLPQLDLAALSTRLQREEAERAQFTDAKFTVVRVSNDSSAMEASLGVPTAAVSRSGRAVRQGRAATSGAKATVTASGSDRAGLLLYRAASTLDMDLGGSIYYQGRLLRLNAPLSAQDVPPGATVFYNSTDRSGGDFDLAAAFASGSTECARADRAREADAGFENAAFATFA